MRSAYIITKPLQYFNATNIADEEENKDCFLINSFRDAREFYLYLESNISFWAKVKLFKSRYRALVYLLWRRKRYSTLYIDSDYSLTLTFFLYFLKGIKIYTFEEGYGSYRLLTSENKISLRIRQYMKFENWIGGGIFTNGVIVYHPKVLNKLIPASKKKQVFQFKNSFFSHLRSLKEVMFFCNEFNSKDYSNTYTFLYLSSWQISAEAIKLSENYPSYKKVIKVHPHIVGDLVLPESFDKLLVHVPAEILIIELLKVVQRLVIVHENSSSLIYLQNEDIKTVKIINIASEQSDYITLWNNLSLDEMNQRI